MAGDDPLGVEVRDPCAGGGDALPGSGSGSGGLLVLLIALLVDAARVMVLEADELDDSPANRRIAVTRWGQPRGEIVVDGHPVNPAP
ncbi:hypothetical protein [Streptomyces sp. WMMC940]|uniref:hypothetical protein n=1 Tax=Streptomyces sp. WMMC940 TaxID=3015153 RepID=UPI0022B64BAB|nr:hypothetical protein [Streptomyces sp. WMMC940]MCZ7460425.1 hypothetical protein [Streptomyces sp. WMMC940]